MAEKENKVIDNLNVNLSDEEKESEDIIKDSYDDALADPIKEAAEIDKVDNKIEISAQQTQKMQENITQAENLAKAEKEAEKKKETKAKENDEPKKSFWASLKNALKKLFNGVVNVAAGALHLAGRVLLGEKGYNAFINKENAQTAAMQKYEKAQENIEKTDTVICASYDKNDKTREFHIQNKDKDAIACVKVNDMGAIISESETKFYIPSNAEQLLIKSLIEKAHENCNDEKEFDKNLKSVFKDNGFTATYDEMKKCIQIEKNNSDIKDNTRCGYIMDLEKDKLKGYEISDKITMFEKSKNDISNMVTEVAKKELEEKTNCAIEINHQPNGKCILMVEEKGKVTQAELENELNENGKAIIEKENGECLKIQKDENSIKITVEKDGHEISTSSYSSQEEVIKNLVKQGAIADKQEISYDEKRKPMLTETQKGNALCEKIVDTTKKGMNEFEKMGPEVSEKIKRERLEKEIEKISTATASLSVGEEVHADVHGCSIIVRHVEEGTLVAEIIGPDSSTQESITGTFGPDFTKGVADKVESFADNADLIENEYERIEDNKSEADKTVDKNVQEVLEQEQFFDTDTMDVEL